MTTRNTKPRSSGDLAGWKSSGRYACRLPSGVEVIIRPLRLEHYMTYGRVPDYLRTIALGELRDKIGDSEKVTPEERAVALEEFVTQFVVPGICQLVVEPELKPEDIPDLPPADVDYLQAIVNMRVTEDALGRAFGPEPLERYAIFREEHRCPDGCAACARVLSAVSAAFN